MASNIVEILIGAKDDAKLDLDSLKQKLTDLAHQVAEAKVKLAGDKEAEASLDRLGVKLLQIDKRTANPKISLEGQFKAMADLGALDVALDRLGRKTEDITVKTNRSGNVFTKFAGILAGFANTADQAAVGGVTKLGSSLGNAQIMGTNLSTIMLGLIPAAAALVVALTPLIASLGLVTVGFGIFGVIAVKEISKVLEAHQKLLAAQQAYEKATTKAGRQSALKAEQQATEDLTGSEKGLMGMLTQLGQQFSKLSRAVQPEIMYSMYKVLDIIKSLMPTLKVLVKAAAVAMADFLNNIANWVASPSGKKFIEWMSVRGPAAIAHFGSAMWATARAVGSALKWMYDAGLVMDRIFTQIWHVMADRVDAARATTVGDIHAIMTVFGALAGYIGSTVSIIKGYINDLIGALSAARSAISGFGGVSGLLGHLGLAAGGISGAASGGVRSNLTLVGERGPELVQLSAGSRVYNNSQTRQMMAGGGSGPVQFVLHVSVAGTKVGHAVIDVVQNHVRTAGGGDVQVALGAAS